MHQKIFEIKSKMKEDSIVLNLFNILDFYFLNSLLSVTLSLGVKD